MTGYFDPPLPKAPLDPDPGSDAVFILVGILVVIWALTTGGC